MLFFGCQFCLENDEFFLAQRRVQPFLYPTTYIWTRPTSIFGFPTNLWTLTLNHPSITLCLSRQQHQNPGEPRFVPELIQTEDCSYIDFLFTSIPSPSQLIFAQSYITNVALLCYHLHFCHPFTGQRHRFQLLFLLKQQQFGRVYLWHIVHRFLITSLAPISVLYHQRQQSSYSRISIWPPLSHQLQPTEHRVADTYSRCLPPPSSSIHQVSLTDTSNVASADLQVTSNADATDNNFSAIDAYILQPSVDHIKSHPNLDWRRHSRRAANFINKHKLLPSSQPSFIDYDNSSVSSPVDQLQIHIKLPLSFT